MIKAERPSRGTPARRDLRPPLRLLMIASWYPSEASPVLGIFVRDQAEILAAGMEVLVIAPALVTRKTLTRWRSVGRSPKSRPDAVQTMRPRVPVIPRLRRLNAWMYRRAVFHAHSKLEGSWGRPDVIAGQVVAPAGTASVELGHAIKVPVIIIEHSGPFAQHGRTPAQARRTRETLERADAVLAVSDVLAREITLAAQVDVSVVGNVIAPTFFAGLVHAPRAASNQRLVAIGLLTWQKRFELLLEATAAAVRSGASLELTIIGDGPDRRKLQDRARTLGIDPLVTFTGIQSREQILDWFQWADALLSTSDRESFGLSIAEALACGLPVITTASGGPESFVDPMLGTIVPAGDASAIAHAILDLPAFARRFDPALARARMAERFGPAAFIAIMNDTLRSVVDAKRET